MNKGTIERNLGLYYGFHSEKLRDIIGPTNGYLEFEKKLLLRRVDIFFEEENHDIFIEIQINDSDDTHLKQILEIIKDNEVLDDTKIIWIATGFLTDHLEEVKKALRRSIKKLEFMALKFDSNKSRELENYANIDDFSIIDKLQYFSIHDDIELVIKFSNKELSNNRKHSFSRLANRNNELIRFYVKEVRKQMPNWVNAYNSKVLSARKISFGGTTNDITFKIGITRNNMFGVDIQFGPEGYDFFRNLFLCSNVIDKNLDPKPNWIYGKNKISYEVPYHKEDKDEVLKRQVTVLKTYLEGLSPLIKERDSIINKSDEELVHFVESLLK